MNLRSFSLRYTLSSFFFLFRLVVEVVKIVLNVTEEKNLRIALLSKHHSTHRRFTQAKPVFRHHFHFYVVFRLLVRYLDFSLTRLPACGAFVRSAAPFPAGFLIM